MPNNKDENKVFINACRKAGLKVQSKESGKIVEGLVIVDARGNRYSVNSDGKIQKIGIVCAYRPSVERRIARLASAAKKVDRRNELRGYRVAKLGRALKKQED